MKNNKGITLIALVVTIIVLLLLAGISISMLTGQNGILNRSSEAKEKTALSNAKEEAEVALNGYLIEKNTNQGENAKEYLEKHLSENQLESIVETGDIITFSYKGQKMRADLANGKIEENNKISIWDGTSASESLEGKGTKEKPYLIKSANDLKYMSNQIETKTDIKGTNEDGSENGENVSAKTACYKLETNIDLNDTTNFENWKEENFDKASLNKWVTIGKTSNNTLSFLGDFDGNGYAINGMYSNESNYCGFIGVLYGKNAVVQNLKITNALVIAENYSGGIVGRIAEGAKVKNCYFSGSVIGTEGAIGAIAGEISTSEKNSGILNCVNDGEVKGDYYVGGIVGRNYGGNIVNCQNNGKIISPQKAAGIAGESGQGNIISCKNNGNIDGGENSNYYSYLAGIVGYMYTTNIEKCINNGNISFENLSNTFFQIGGIVGIVQTNDDEIVIKDTVNNGNITAGNSAKLGQIIGQVYSYNGKKVILNNVINNGIVKFENGNLAEIVGEGEDYEVK